MPWKEVKPMDEKLHFITDFNDQLFDFAELCRRYGISRKTGYKYTLRYQKEGLDGLKPRSSRPHHSPAKTDLKIEKAIIELKHIRPERGAKKLIYPYRKKYPGWHVCHRAL